VTPRGNRAQARAPKLDGSVFAVKMRGSGAGIAQLVEHDLAKVGVASSSLVSRSSFFVEASALRRGFVVSAVAGDMRKHARGLHIRTHSVILFDSDAGIAQLVEHDLAKVGVASSSLVSRSSFQNLGPPGFCCFQAGRGDAFRAQWPGGRVVMQRPAKPRTPVRFRPWPPLRATPKARHRRAFSWMLAKHTRASAA
jgi:hypothetical protein